MPGPSADERIKRFLKRRAQERAQAEVARQEHDEREQQHERIIERIKAKWTADVDLIAAILAELQAKLADEDLEVKFQDIGPSGDAIVRGLITGRFLGEPINVTSTFTLVELSYTKQDRQAGISMKSLLLPRSFLF